MHQLRHWAFKILWKSLHRPMSRITEILTRISSNHRILKAVWMHQRETLVSLLIILTCRQKTRWGTLMRCHTSHMLWNVMHFNHPLITTTILSIRDHMKKKILEVSISLLIEMIEMDGVVNQFKSTRHSVLLNQHQNMALQTTKQALKKWGWGRWL